MKNQMMNVKRLKRLKSKSRNKMMVRMMSSKERKPKRKKIALSRNSERRKRLCRKRSTIKSVDYS